MDASGHDPGFDRALTREILASEILRAGVMTATLGGLLVFVTAAFAIGHDVFQRFAGKPISALLPVYVVGPFFIYECAFLIGLRMFAARGRPPPRPAPYGNAIVETSLPSVILLVASGYADPTVIFGGWPVFLYFVFILAATLRLNLALPMLTGVVAGAEYMAVAAYVFPLSFSADRAELIPVFHLGRVAIMLIAGLVAGLVAMRLRANLVRVLEESAERDRVTALFGQHVSPSVVDRLLDANVGTEGEARQVCILFLDFRDFTAFARQRTPEEVVDFLNRSFAFMIEAVDHHQGIINKFLGDGFMATFGAPLTDPDAATHAVATAREILAEMDRRAAPGGTGLRVGIGIHVGVAVTGSIGSPRRKEFTVIGDIVNLAARIEQLNKEFGSRLLVSQAVADAIGAGLGGAGPLQAEVKGYADPIAVWRLD